MGSGKKGKHGGRVGEEGRPRQTVFPEKNGAAGVLGQGLTHEKISKNRGGSVFEDQVLYEKKYRERGKPGCMCFSRGSKRKSGGVGPEPMNHGGDGKRGASVPLCLNKSVKIGVGRGETKTSSISEKTRGRGVRTLQRGRRKEKNKVLRRVEEQIS